MDAKTKGKLIGYARVSTEDQELHLQIDALTRAGCWNIYQEKRSAKAKRRPQLELALMDIRPGDTLVVWRLDRLARDARQLYRILDQIHGAGAQFKSLQEQFEFTTPMGAFVLGILGLVAQLEQQMTAQRTAAGMAAMRARGVDMGAPRKMTPERIKMAKKLLRKPDWSVARVAQKFGIADNTVYKYLRGGKTKLKGRRTYVMVQRKPKTK